MKSHGSFEDGTLTFLAEGTAGAQDFLYHDDNPRRIPVEAESECKMHFIPKN